MKSTYYVTTPIYYVNGHPHLGNTYTTTLADMLTRYHRFLGQETFFLTGADEHGDKIAQAAAAAGKTPQEFTDEVSGLFKRTWEDLGLKFNRFIRTTEAQHKKVVQEVLQNIFDKGDIYFGEYGGNYCFGCERFLTDKELIDGKCPDHQTPPKYIAEKNYFFRMSKYQDRLVEYITAEKPDFIRPDRYKNEVLAMLREPIEDLCISRPKSRLTWGIELPFDKEYVTYVWFDALLNYITGVDYPDGKNFERFWPSCEHLVAKDIIKPHGIFWPTMLMAAGIPLYDHLTVHGYWVTPIGKMSKTLGNVIDPLKLREEYGMDVFRYIVFREMTFGLDGVFNMDTLETRYNADLANNLGNLVSRSLAMVHKYREGKMPEPSASKSEESLLSAEAEKTAKDLATLMETREIHRALERVWQFIDQVNIYIDRTKPWALAKQEKSDPKAKAELDTSLYNQIESIRFVATILAPFMPDTSTKILGFLGYREKELAFVQQARALDWGLLKPGTAVEKGETLFPRREKMEQTEATPPSEKSAPKPVDNLITFDEFSKVDLRVGQILSAERVPKSEKLLKLRVDLGEASGPRQIVSGIAKYYAPEDLPGKKVAVVANLKPAKLMGLESQGMLLAGADVAGDLELVSVGDMLPAGSEIR